MKTTKKLITLLIALSLLSSTVLYGACSNDETLTLPPAQSEESVPPPPAETPSLPPVRDDNASVDKENDKNETVVLPVQPVVEKAQYITCTGDSVNLRSGAGTSYAVVGSAKKGETYALVGKSGQWYKTYYRGKTVYLSASYAAVLSVEKNEDTQVEKVIQEGYKLLGVPYVYGAVRVHDGKGRLLSGFTTQKFDCSSLVQYVFYKGADKLLDVNTRTQVKQGKFVAKKDLQRGDCMFFTNESRQYLTGIERVGHVAIYLGDNYILHTASDYARIEKMTASRWKFYIESRRFI